MRRVAPTTRRRRHPSAARMDSLVAAAAPAAAAQGRVPDGPVPARRPRRPVRPQLVRRGVDADDDQHHRARRARTAPAAPRSELYDLAREVSPWIERRPGASTYGWAGGLTELGYGPFGELSATGKRRRSASPRARCATPRKPVGLLVWRGRHAWVMSGFRATADPAYTDDFEVTGVWIEDPWAGRVSRTWGPGPRTPYARRGRVGCPGSRAGRAIIARSSAAMAPYVMVAPLAGGHGRRSRARRRPRTSTAGGLRALAARPRAGPGPVGPRLRCGACASPPGTSTRSRRAWTPSSDGSSGPRRTCC